MEPGKDELVGNAHRSLIQRDTDVLIQWEHVFMGGVWSGGMGCQTGPPGEDCDWMRGIRGS